MNREAVRSLNGMKKQQPTNRPVRSLPVGDISMLSCCLRLPRLILHGKFCRTVVVLNAT